MSKRVRFGVHGSADGEALRFPPGGISEFLFCLGQVACHLLARHHPASVLADWALDPPINFDHYRFDGPSPFADLENVKTGSIQVAPPLSERDERIAFRREVALTMLRQSGWKEWTGKEAKMANELEELVFGSHSG